MCEVVDPSEVKLKTECVMLSVNRVATNKGSVECPKPKACLVAREFVSDTIDRVTLFSSTPGLPSARSMMSRSATLRSSGKKLRIMLLEVTASFLNGERPPDIEIPRRNLASENPRLVARLVRSLHGTRHLFASDVCGTLRALGYQETKGGPGVFWHAISGVGLVLHVDDFLVVGEDRDLQDLYLTLKAVYKLQKTFIGGDRADKREGTYLGRTIG